MMASGRNDSTQHAPKVRADATERLSAAQTARTGTTERMPAVQATPAAPYPGGSERINVHTGGNVYAADQQARQGQRMEARRVFLLFVAFVVVACVILILPTGAFAKSLTGYPLSAFLADVSTNVQSLVNLAVGASSGYETRLMAVIVCAVSGAALGLCGSTFQGAFNNPLAAPKTLGVMSGGAVGALVYVLWLKQYTPVMPASGGSVSASQIAGWMSSLSPFEWFYFNYGKSLCSIAGCLLVVSIVVVLTTFLGRGRLSNIIVIIFGQVFSVGVTAVIQFARYYFTVGGNADMAQQLAEIENYTMINTYYFHDLLIVVLPIVACIVIVLLMRRRLTLLSFGDDVAGSMGINVKATRYAMIAVCTIMTGFAISFCGHIAFLGFISAQLARRIVGPDFRFLLPASIAVGGTLILVIQWVCESGLPFTSSYAAGPTCSVIGACVFLFVVLRQRGGAHNGWN